MSAQRSLLLLLLAAGLPAMATDGYFSMGYGTASKGLGGAGAALSLDTLSSAANPASLVGVGDRADVGFAWFSPRRDFEVQGNPSGYPGTFPLRPGKVESGSTSFLVPSLGINWKLTDRAAFGIAIYGNGGMNTNYDASVFGGGSTGVNLSQLFVAPTFACTFAKGHSVGLSAVLAYQTFEAKGLGMFGAMGFSSSPDNLSGRGKDSSMGHGLRVGYLGNLTPWLSLGTSYQTRTRMGGLKKYQGLFAELGGFDIPSNYTLGLAFHPTGSLTVALDAERINYSEVKSISNPMLPNLMQARLGDAGGAGFGWRDVEVFKLGLQWQATRALTLRTGYNHCTQPVPSGQVMFNILAPGVVQDHFTLGATQALTPKTSLSLSIMRALGHRVTGPNPLEAPGAQTITLRMDQWEVELGFAYRL